MKTTKDFGSKEVLEVKPNRRKSEAGLLSN